MAVSAITPEMIKDSEVPEDVITLATALSKYPKGRIGFQEMPRKNPKFGNQYLVVELRDGKLAADGVTYTVKNKDRIPKFEITKAFSQFGIGEAKKKTDDKKKDGKQQAPAAEDTGAKAGNTTSGSGDKPDENPDAENKGKTVAFPLEKNDAVVKEFALNFVDENMIDAMYERRVPILKDEEIDKKGIKRMMMSSASKLEDEAKRKTFGDNLKIKIPENCECWLAINDKQMTETKLKDIENKPGRFTIIFTWPREYLQGGLPPKTFGKVFVAEKVLYYPLPKSTSQFSTQMEVVPASQAAAAAQTTPPAAADGSGPEQRKRKEAPEAAPGESEETPSKQPRTE